MYNLLYTSVAPQGFSDSELKELLEEARLKNQRLGVTGMLVYDDCEIMQILEGEEVVVRDLYQTIQADVRHLSVNVFHEGPIEKRAFTDWSMAFKVLEDADRDLLIAGYEQLDPTRTPIKLVKDSPNLGKRAFLNLLKSL